MTRRRRGAGCTRLDCHVATLLAMTEIPLLSARAFDVATARYEAIRACHFPGYSKNKA
ncbi:MAG: hypothetical protein LBF85_02220 [Tannerella sp.]|nr:hypothetical protein [Tannerella sp.]